MKTYNVTFTDGNFEKTVSALDIIQALDIAKNTAYFPIEISDYSEMKIIIEDSNGDEIITLDSNGKQL